MGRKTKAQENDDRLRLSEAELSEYCELLKAANFMDFIAELVTKNTLVVPNGQDTAKTLTAISNLVNSQFRNYQSQTLFKHGVKAGELVQINTDTGEIRGVPTPNA